MEGEQSELVPVEPDVPQGTLLGSLMYLCQINDLPDTVKSQVRLFADECLLYRQIRSQSDHLIIINGLDPLRAKKTFIRKKLGHTMVSAIKASSVTL